MHDAFARPRAFTHTSPAPGRGRRLLTAALATVLLVAPASIVAGVAMDAAPAAAAEVSIPLAEDVQTRMTSHTGWDGSTAANPNTGDCVRYGSAADTVASGSIDNPGGAAGAQSAAWADGATGWVTAGTTAYSASPPIEYMANGLPSARCSRVVPSYSVPRTRLSPKNVSHRSSRPRAHERQNPHGIRNAATTGSPGAHVTTPSPTASTTPDTS